MTEKEFEKATEMQSRTSDTTSKYLKAFEALEEGYKKENVSVDQLMQLRLNASKALQEVPA